MVEWIDFDLWFRWFVGRGVVDLVWDATTFGKNHDRLLAGKVANRFLVVVLARGHAALGADRRELALIDRG